MPNNSKTKSKAEMLEAIGDLHRITQLNTDLLDEAASHALGLNRTDHRTLDVLQRIGPITAGRLAAEAGLSPGAMTSAIDRLEKAGYARRVPDPEDRRRILVEITEDGMKDAWAIYGPMKEDYIEMMGSFPMEFLERLRDYLEKGIEIGAEHTERVQGMSRKRRAT